MLYYSTDVLMVLYRRLNAVEVFVCDPILRERVRIALRTCCDLERMVQKVSRIALSRHKL